MATENKIESGFERVSVVTEDRSGNKFFQVEGASGDFYLCDIDGDKVQLSSWTLVKVLGDAATDDVSAFFALLASTDEDGGACHDQPQ